MFGAHDAWADGANGYLTIGLKGFNKDKNLKTMDGMFANCKNLITINFDKDATKFDTSSVKSMNYTFYGCYDLLHFDNEIGVARIYPVLEQMDTTNVTSWSVRYSLYMCNKVVSYSRI